MKYKGYAGHVIYDDEAKIFSGQVLGIIGAITFQGTSVDELEQAFHDSVDCYLALCKERGERPHKPYSGTFNLRLPPVLHARLAMAAKIAGNSMNTHIVALLEEIMR